MTFYLFIAILGGFFLGWMVWVLAMTAEARTQDWKSEANGPAER
jgi:hypothetical protein